MMVSQLVKKLTSSIIDLQKLDSHSFDLKEPASFTALNKIKDDLSILVGSIGFQALLSRALTLTKAEESILELLSLNNEGDFEGLDEMVNKYGTEKLNEAGSVLLSYFLNLLIIFIGEALTLQFMKILWPEIPVQALSKNNLEIIE